MNEDLLNVMGSFSEISLDCLEKQNEEIEQLEKENQELKDRINKAIEYINNNQLFEFKYDEEELFEYITDLKVKEELRKILKEDNKEIDNGR